MRCQIYQWRVSSALDRQRDIPEYIKRHMERCPGCRNFILAVETWESSAKNNAEMLIQTRKESSPVEEFSVPVQSSRLENKRDLLPLYAGGLVVLLLVFLLVRPGLFPVPDSLPQQLSSLPDSFSPGDSLRKLSDKVESPVLRELQSLQRLLHTARDTFRSSFDLGLDLPLE